MSAAAADASRLRVRADRFCTWPGLGEVRRCLLCLAVLPRIRAAAIPPVDGLLEAYAAFRRFLDPALRVQRLPAIDHDGEAFDLVATRLRGEPVFATAIETRGDLLICERLEGLDAARRAKIRRALDESRQLVACAEDVGGEAADSLAALQPHLPRDDSATARLHRLLSVTRSQDSQDALEALAASVATARGIVEEVDLPDRLAAELARLHANSASRIEGAKLAIASAALAGRSRVTEEDLAFVQRVLGVDSGAHASQQLVEAPDPGLDAEISEEQPVDQGAISAEQAQGRVAGGDGQAGDAEHAPEGIEAARQGRRPAQDAKAVTQQDDRPPSESEADPASEQDPVLSIDDLSREMHCAHRDPSTGASPARSRSSAEASQFRARTTAPRSAAGGCAFRPHRTRSDSPAESASPLTPSGPPAPQSGGEFVTGGTRLARRARPRRAPCAQDLMSFASGARVRGTLHLIAVDASASMASGRLRDAKRAAPARYLRTAYRQTRRCRDPWRSQAKSVRVLLPPTTSMAKARRAAVEALPATPEALRSPARFEHVCEAGRCRAATESGRRSSVF